jgi:hypothetical protein
MVRSRGWRERGGGENSNKGVNGGRREPPSPCYISRALYFSTSDLKSHNDFMVEVQTVSFHFRVNFPMNNVSLFQYF